MTQKHSPPAPLFRFRKGTSGGHSGLGHPSASGGCSLGRDHTSCSCVRVSLREPQAWGALVFHCTQTDRARPTETGAWQGCSPQGPGLAPNWVGGGHDPRVSPPPQAHSRCCGRARNDQGLELSPPTLLSPSDSAHWAGEAPWGPDKGAPETPFLLPDHRWVSGIPASVAFWGPGAFSEDSGAASLVAMMMETGMGISRAWHRGSPWAVAALVG